MKDDNKVHTAITILSAIAGLPVILFLLFIMRMKF